MGVIGGVYNFLWSKRKLILAVILAVFAHYIVFRHEYIEFTNQKDINYNKSPTKVFPPSQWRILEKELDIGDLLECPRDHDYSHWGVHITERRVVHLMSNGTVLMETLESFMKKGKCRKNNLKSQAASRGLIARDSMEIVDSAIKYHELSTFQYKLLKSNCQHFATLCRFGEGFSDMVDNAKDNTIKAEKVVKIVDKLVFG